MTFPEKWNYNKTQASHFLGTNQPSILFSHHCCFSSGHWEYEADPSTTAEGWPHLFIFSIFQAYFTCHSFPASRGKCDVNGNPLYSWREKCSDQALADWSKTKILQAWLETLEKHTGGERTTEKGHCMQNLLANKRLPVQKDLQAQRIYCIDGKTSNQRKASEIDSQAGTFPCKWIFT